MIDDESLLRRGLEWNFASKAKPAHRAFNVLTICARAIQPTDQMLLAGYHRGPDSGQLAPGAAVVRHLQFNPV
jgi:hypothetical protein